MAKLLTLDQPGWFRVLLWAVVLLAPGGLLLLPALCLGKRSLGKRTVERAPAGLALQPSGSSAASIDPARAA